MTSTAVPPTSRSSTRPPAATAAPTTVRRPGRWPPAHHIQHTTATGAVYSINSATATSRRATDMK